MICSVADDLDPLCKIIRDLILPGQRRLHMKDENDRRKRAIASAIIATGIQVTVYDAARRYATSTNGGLHAFAPLSTTLPHERTRCWYSNRTTRCCAGTIST